MIYYILDTTESWNHNICVPLMVDFDNFLFEDSINCSDYGRVTSKKNLGGPQNHNVQEVQTQIF